MKAELGRSHASATKCVAEMLWKAVTHAHAGADTHACAGAPWGTLCVTGAMVTLQKRCQRLETSNKHNFFVLTPISELFFLKHLENEDLPSRKDLGALQ